MIDRTQKLRSRQYRRNAVREERDSARWSTPQQLRSLLFTTEVPCLSRYCASQKRSRSPRVLGDTVRHNGARINRITGGVVVQPSFSHCCPRMHVSTHERKHARKRTPPASGDAIALSSCRSAPQLCCRATLIIYVRAREL